MRLHPFDKTQSLTDALRSPNPQFQCTEPLCHPFPTLTKSNREAIKLHLCNRLLHLHLTGMMPWSPFHQWRVAKIFTLDPGVYLIHHLPTRRRRFRFIAPPAKASHYSKTLMRVPSASVAFAQHVWRCLWQSTEQEGSALAVLQSAGGSSLSSSTSDKALV